MNISAIVFRSLTGAKFTDRVVSLKVSGGAQKPPLTYFEVSENLGGKVDFHLFDN